MVVELQLQKIRRRIDRDHEEDSDDAVMLRSVLLNFYQTIQADGSKERTFSAPKVECSVAHASISSRSSAL